MDYARGDELSALLEEKKKLSEEEAKLIFNRYIMRYAIFMEKI